MRLIPTSYISTPGNMLATDWRLDTIAYRPSVCRVIQGTLRTTGGAPFFLFLLRQFKLARSTSTRSTLFDLVRIPGDLSLFYLKCGI